MEDTLVNDIKRLRVLTPSDHDNMDEQVQDSCVQAVESPCISKACKSSQVLKRDEKLTSKSATCSTEKSVLKSSDESESSLDDGIHYRMLGGGSQSDSDGLENIWHQQKLNSWRPSTAPMVESDSVNENFHPTRQQRRKRKFKRMAVDPHPSIGSTEVISKCMSSKSDSKHSHGQRTSKNLVKVSLDHDDVENIWKKFLENPESFCGKRKRSIREKSAECSGTDKRPNFNPRRMIGNPDSAASWPNHNYIMECDGVGHSTQWEPSSSGLSSSESECGILTNDEGREADDEQSDCFHESSTSSGILVDELLPRNLNTFRRRFEYITSYGPRVSQLKHSLLESWKKREITSGRRRLMKFKPIVCHSLKEDTLRNEFVQGDVLRNGSKKRRKVPSATSPFQTGIAQSSLPGSECHGNSSGWSMEWKPEPGSTPWSSRTQKYTTGPSLTVKKRGLSLSEVPQDSAQVSLSQNNQHPYSAPHTFVPAHNPGDLSLPFMSSKNDVNNLNTDFNILD